jgi:hypothetical protein
LYMLCSSNMMQATFFVLLCLAEGKPLFHSALHRSRTCQQTAGKQCNDLNLSINRCLGKQAVCQYGLRLLSDEPHRIIDS